MFFSIEWGARTDRSSAGIAKPVSLETSLVRASGITAIGSEGGEVAVVFEPASYELAPVMPEVSYVQALDYAGVGLLSEWLSSIEELLPEVDGPARLCVGAVPECWSETGREVELIRGCGFAANIDGRCLRVSSSASPKTALRRLRVLLFALDPEGRSLVWEEQRDAIGLLALAEFGSTPVFAQLLKAINTVEAGKGRWRPAITSPAGAAWADNPAEVESIAGTRFRVGREEFDSAREDLSRFAIDPRWLIYLPPGMSSVQVAEGEYLEHPTEVFRYYRGAGVPRVVVEQKHMGSRAIVVVCERPEVAAYRFGLPKESEALGCVYTRKGRPFFSDTAEEQRFLERLRTTLTLQGFWKRRKTDWVLLDGEMLPWSLKAEGLIEGKHGDIVSAGMTVLSEAARRVFLLAGEEVRSHIEERLECMERYARLIERYQKERGNPPRFAPFHILATEGQTYFDRSHVWHMGVAGRMARRSDGLLLETPFQAVFLDDRTECERAVQWWTELTEALGEGVVIKPGAFNARGRRGGVQPAIKCRGREHLRLVYGPEYDLPENLQTLRSRPAFARRRQKHRRVLRQFGACVEGLIRFVRGEPIGKVQACVIATRAMEQPLSVAGDFT